MVTTISKEDLKTVLAKPITPVPATTDFDKAMRILNQVDTLLKNDVIKGVLTRIMSRFGMKEVSSGLTPLPTPENKSSNPLNPEMIYNMILNTVNSILKFGDMPLSKVKEYLLKNKKDVIQLITDGIKGKVKPVEPK